MRTWNTDFYEFHKFSCSIFFYCQIILIHKVTVDYITAHLKFMCWTYTFSTYCITPEKIPSEDTLNLWFLPCLRHLPALLKMNNMLKTTEQILYFFVISKLYFFPSFTLALNPLLLHLFAVPHIHKITQLHLNVMCIAHSYNNCLYQSNKTIISQSLRKQ